MEKPVTYKCCLCNEDFIGYGNNALPLNSGKCCNMCNIEQVIPIRLMLKNFKDDKDEEHLHNDEK